tara:strand:+ start:78 stop:362 length:285 start_codon:yes stop_codon:yes gene_type:complete
MMNRRGLLLPCEKCGAVIEFDRISLPNKTLNLNDLEQNQGSLPMKTYAGQTWLVTDLAGRPVFYFIAEKEKVGAIGAAKILPDKRDYNKEGGLT